MSQENVQLYRRTVEEINRGHVSQELLAADFVIENVATAVTDKTYRGAAGVLEWLTDMSDAFGGDARMEVEEIVADTDDFVVGRVAFVGSGAHSGAPLRLRWASVYWFQDGKLALIRGYAGVREALKAVGLEE